MVYSLYAYSTANEIYSAPIPTTCWKTMQRLTIASTTLIVSRIGFGTGSLHHLYQQSEKHSILANALDVGITHFDTAPMYGEGLAERTLGKFLSGSVRQRVTLTTKIGFPCKRLPELSPKLMIAEKALTTVMRRFGISASRQRERNLSEESCEKSLKRSLFALKTDWIDLLMVHDPLQTEVTEVCRLAEWLNKQKFLGRARYIGLAGNAKNCITIAEQVPGLFDVMQVVDSIEGNEAAPVSSSGWPMQITYGYLRNSFNQRRDYTLSEQQETYRSLLSKNPNGMILFSTRKRRRLKELSNVAEECHVP